MENNDSALRATSSSSNRPSSRSRARRQTRNRAQLDPFKRELEYSIWVSRLAKILFDERAELASNPGRLRIFAEHLLQNDALLDVIQSGGTTNKIGSSWRTSLAAPGPDLRIIHALAILFREGAHNLNQKSKRAQEYWRLSTSFWILLLSTPAFLEDFSQRRFLEKKSKERIDLTPEQLEALFERAVNKIVATHSERAAQALSAGCDDEVRHHGRCLEMIWNGPDTLLSKAKEFGLHYPADTSPKRLARAAAIAREHFENWGNKVLSIAKRDLKVTDNLPKGMTKNYPRATQRMKPFVALGIPIQSLLSFGIDCYIGWTSHAYQKNDRDEMRDINHDGRDFAEQLARVLDPSKPEQPANQSLSYYYRDQGVALIDVDGDYHGARKAIEKSLKWYPKNENSHQLMDQLENLYRGGAFDGNRRSYTPRNPHTLDASFANEAGTPIRRKAKPNPFSVLELPRNAPTAAVVKRGRQLADGAPDTESEQKIRNAVEELITKPEDRLYHELFELSGAFYLPHERKWGRFLSRFRRPKIEATDSGSEENPPALDDISLPELTKMIFSGWMAAPPPPLDPALDEAPVETGAPPKTLEINDALFT